MMQIKMLSLTGAVVLLAGMLSAQAADALFNHTHRGMKEGSVASNWFGGLPKWAGSQTAVNQFPQTFLPFEPDGRQRLRPVRNAVNRFEIRDVNERQFNAFLMVQDNVDGNGRPVYKATNESGWAPWNAWPAKYLFETYPVTNNDNVADLVAFGAWLYSQRENDLANRVLTVAASRDAELRPLIAAYLCEKERWTLPDEGLVEWKQWDIEFQRERVLLVTPDEKTKREAAREKAASDLFNELVSARGDYRGRPGTAQRRRPPTRQLMLLEWQFKELNRAYGETAFLNDERRKADIQAIMDSIKDDLAFLREQLDRSRTMAESGNPRDQRAKAEFLEALLPVDPSDMRLRAEVGHAWLAWANIADHGNGADRTEGCKRAIPHYEEVLKLYPNNTAFLLAIGRCYQALEDSNNARRYYERVKAIDGAGGLSGQADGFIRNMEQKDQARSQRRGR
jgi:tetratricopeptide (TPR) repeat protein